MLFKESCLNKQKSMFIQHNSLNSLNSNSLPENHYHRDEPVQWPSKVTYSPASDIPSIIQPWWLVIQIMNLEKRVNKPIPIRLSPKGYSQQLKVTSCNLWQKQRINIQFYLIWKDRFIFDIIQLNAMNMVVWSRTSSS